MIVLVTGDRHWSDVNAIRRELIKIHPDVIIQGGATGADTIAKYVGHEIGARVIQCDAKWSKYGFAAGPIRNKQMLVDYKPTLVLAFHPDLSKSKGTADCVKQARELGIKVLVFKK